MHTTKIFPIINLKISVIFSDLKVERILMFCCSLKSFMWTESTIMRAYFPLLQPFDASISLGSNDTLADFPHSWTLIKVCEIG